MDSFKRRDFIKLLGIATSASSFPFSVSAAVTAPRVIVVGGGFGGATVAKYLRMWGGNVDVTLIDPRAAHVAGILSNLVVTGEMTLSDISFGYAALSSQHGVRVMQDRVIDVDPVSRTVRLAGGSTLPYDRLVLSPGIDFMPIPGWDSTLVPHAWQAGEQTTLLQQQLAAMPAGGSFIITVPKAPYRCPPAPYERACMIADFLRQHKPGSRVIVLDANPGITVEADDFGHAFNVTYSDIVEYYPNTEIIEVDSANRAIYTSHGYFDASVLNVIPEQQAGKIVRNIGLATAAGNRWAPIDPLSYRSDVVDDIHIIGDSQSTGQPKSGHMANSQAKICADAILRAFCGEAPSQAPMTNSAGFSPLSLTTASWLTATFRYNPNLQKMQLLQESFGTSDGPTSNNYKEMFTWADILFGDTFC